MLPTIRGAPRGRLSQPKPAESIFNRRRLFWPRFHRQGNNFKGRPSSTNGCWRPSPATSPTERSRWELSGHCLIGTLIGPVLPTTIGVGRIGRMPGTANASLAGRDAHRGDRSETNEAGANLWLQIRLRADITLSRKRRRANKSHASPIPPALKETMESRSYRPSENSPGQTANPWPMLSFSRCPQNRP